MFLTDFMKHFNGVEIIEWGKADQGRSILPEGGPLCPGILVDEILDPGFQPISSAIGNLVIFV